jgi:flagellar L-ring protein precursor FlgH
LFSYSGTTSHAGSGVISRSETVTAQIPARVMKVLDNGLLVIEGRRVAVVNNETTTLAFSGVVRPEDLTPDNTVNSTQVADAEITMLGKGTVQENQKPGLFNRLLSILGVF